MNDPLISAIIPCYNGAELLEGCVRSILDQNASCEIIVVDDGSTDSSLERARALQQEIPVPMLVLTQKNAGPAAARNIGLRLARSNYVCFLDVDDRYVPGFFAATVPILEKEPAVIAAFCQIELVNAHRTIETWQREAIERMLPCNVLLRTEVVRQIGGFPEQAAFRGKTGGEDGAFRDELYKHGKIVKLSKALFQHRMHVGGHVDAFLDRAHLVDSKIQFRETPHEEEGNGSVKAAVREYKDTVQDRMLARTLETLRTSVMGSLEFHRLAERLDKVEGYLHPAEGFTLYSLARRWPVQGMTVEVGSHMGRSTCWLAAGCRDSRSDKVVAVDHFRASPEHHKNAGDLAAVGSTLPVFRRNVEEQKLNDWVNVRVGSSAEASQGWKGPIRLLFIDGERTAQAVRADFASWSPHVGPRGLVVFHDVGVFPAVTQFYTELCAPGSGWKEVARFHTLGVLQRTVKQNQSAKLESEAAGLREILQKHPHQVDALFRLAQVLESQKAWEESIATYRKLLHVRPDHAEAHNFLGIQLARRQKFDEAMEHFRTYLKLQPGRAAGHHNMGVACADQEKTAEAIPHFEEALRNDPQHAEAHKGKGMALLKLGRFSEGWPEYEWRWRCKDLTPLQSPRPMWDGSPLQGQTILLHSEQGMGDTLQFIRYAPLVKERGGMVLVACPAPLLPILRTCPGIDRIVARKNNVPHDVHIPLLSLPRVLGTEVDSIPCSIPYLRADAERRQFWKNELAELDGFKVGIAWQGNPKHTNDVNRSIPLSLFQPLAEVPGVRLFSLQVGKGSEQIEELAGRFPVTNLRKRIEGAFTETAAVMTNLDLVICCDTSVAHLAGALGVPVWVALTFAADWRWLQGRDDSPWYPTMRLFKQRNYKDWAEVFARIAEALRLEAAKPRPAGVTVPDLPEDAVPAVDVDADQMTYVYSALPESEISPSPFAGYSSQPSSGPAPKTVSPQLAQVRWLMNAQKHPQAEQFLRDMLVHEPADADAWFHLAQVQRAQNHLSDAIDSFGRLLSLRPDHAEGHANLGILLCRKGDKKRGEACLREAIRLQPNIPKAHNNLGVVLAETGRRAEALACWQETVKIDPNYPEGHFNLAVGLAENRQPEQAVEHYERALLLRPDYAEAYSNLGLLRVDDGRPAEAVVLLQHAVRLKPDFADAHNNLGLAYADLGRHDEALACYDKALSRRPRYPEVYNNYGTALAAAGRADEALACFAQALRIRPNYPEARWHQALTWLTQGDMTRGWPEYEWRWKRKRSRPRRFKEPLWDGSNLEGKTILLWCEQGLGDSLQFIRYAPLVKARGGNVVIECPDKLLALFFTCAGPTGEPIGQVVAQQRQLPPFDVQVPLLSLPGIFGTRLHSIPADVPYLHAAEKRIKETASWLADARETSFRIGIVWQGNPKHRWDRHRSFALECFQALARLEGVHLYSLQKGVPGDDLAHFSRRHGLIDLSAKLEDFTDTAAVMKNLDLIITCDSAPAHLAGSLGVPVWVPLSAMSDWRWLKERDDSPWYPSMRLFRQKKLGDWREVFERITTEVARLSRNKQAPSAAQETNLLRRGP